MALKNINLSFQLALDAWSNTIFSKIAFLKRLILLTGNSNTQ